MTLFPGVRRRWPAAVVAVLAMTATALPLSPAAADDKTAPQPAAPVTLDGVRPGTHEITLITGDKVTLTDMGGGHYGFRVRAAAGPGRPEPVFHGRSGPDGFYVFPGDVLPAIEAGRVDRELFDVKYLAEHGYAEGRSTPVIVQYDKSTKGLRSAAEALPASTPTATLDSIGGVALAVPHDSTATFWSAVQGRTVDRNAGGRAAGTLGAGLAKVWLDRKVAARLDRSVPLIGAPQAWAAGLDGAGVKVAVLDSGIDDTHPDLAGRIADSRSFVDGAETAKDGHGHGTHVASIITGSGAASGGTYKGVAPGVKLVVGKVLDDSGSGSWSDVVEGMQWAAGSGARIVSMSLGGEATDGTDPVSQALDSLTAETGALFVVAAGNVGAPESVGTPGAALSALTVAATDLDDKLAPFSSRGPRIDGALKPDIAAPGVNIVAARAAGTSMGDPAGDSYTAASGTSMAAPHVSGAAAILAQRHPDWRAAELKAALMSTVKEVGGTVYERGAGRLDLANALTQRVHATTANLDYGAVAEGSAPVGKQVVYANTSDRPVTLTLTPKLTTVAGAAVPEGVLTVDGTLTVPAGGTATATVTLTPAALGLGTYTGAVTATDGQGTRLTVPVGLTREPPKVTLTVRVLDGEGTAVNPSLLNVLDITGGRGDLTRRARWESPGVFTVQVPRGSYDVSGFLQWIDPVSYLANAGWLLRPQVEVTGDTEVTLDGRELKEIGFDTPRPAVASPGSEAFTSFQRTVEDGSRWTSYTASAPYVRHWITPTRKVTKGSLLFSTYWGLAAPEVTMEVRGRDPLKLHPEVYPHDGGSLRNIPLDYVPFTGDLTANLVDAGVGTKEALAGLDLRGKLALLDDDGGCAAGLDRVRNLRDAGAAGFLMWPSAPLYSCGFGPHIPQMVAPESWDTRASIDIPYVTVSPAEARELKRRLAKGPVSVAVHGTPRSSYGYQLYPAEKDRVPATIPFRITDRRLTTIDTRYHAAAPTDFFATAAIARKGQATSFHTRLPVIEGPGTRTEYAGPVDPEAIVYRQVEGARSPLSSSHVFDRAGPHTQHWNAGPLTPGSATVSDAVRRLLDPQFTPLFAPCSICRQGDVLWTNHTEIGAQGQSGDTLIGGTRLYRNGTEIPAVLMGGLPAYPMPKEAGDYRLTFDNPGTGTSAEWTFRSATVTTDATPPTHVCVGFLAGVTGPCRPEPVVFVAYDLTGGLGLDNSVPAGRRHTFDVRVYHSPATGSTPAVAGLKVWASTDGGERWTAADVRRGRDGTWTASVSHPRHAKGAVALRAEAWDAAGNRVTQTSLSAYTLR
ncbi:S8 family serine peptidase [Nonomuraea wenchangensis]|uniref:Serine protease, subtilisin family n=1 Tax=Nonomuraea wenchangensis TaxID=568860 RepID=A0A1I0AQ84_9ACTN|nr:S8 family serine peptidase [Nonomuraea wenchangensis]SES95609.1 Serine protease, subtilisin family [Nonomuraea wenchangensis]